MTNRRVKAKDMIKEDFYQMPKIFVWSKRYREGLSTEAKMLYSLIKDRHSLSEYTTMQQELAGDQQTYKNEDGEIYCILDNSEIGLSMNKSGKSVKSYLDELARAEIDLIDMEPRPGSTPLIYLKLPESDGTEFDTFMAEKAYHKHVTARKKKGKEPLKTLEDFIAERKDIHKKQEGRKSSTPAESQEGRKSFPPSGEESDTPSGVKVSPLGAEKLRGNKNYSSPTELSDNELNDTELSSSGESESKPAVQDLEEVKNVIRFNNNYESLENILVTFNFPVDQKGLNVIKKMLMENKIESFPVSDVAYAALNHPKNVEEWEEKNGESVRYQPAFFGNNLVKMIQSRAAVREAEALNKQHAQGSSLPEEQTYRKVEFYNWIEDRS